MCGGKGSFTFWTRDIDSGRYIERLFPALGVRFIAINDNYDSVTGSHRGMRLLFRLKT